MLAVNDWSRTIIMLPRVTQADILDVAGQKLLPPRGSPPVRLKKADFAFLDVLTRHMGRVVTHEEMINAVYPDGCEVMADPVYALHSRAFRLRDWLARIGWSDGVLVARPGAGWEVDPDVVARDVMEARNGRE